MKNVEILDCIDCLPRWGVDACIDTVNAIQRLPSWQRLLTEYKNFAIFSFDSLLCSVG